MQVKKEYVISKQLLKAGTSIGANVEEAQQAQSKKDFIAKLSISLKEANETRYWLRLISDSSKEDQKSAHLLIQEVEELIRLLTAIIKKAKTNM